MKKVLALLAATVWISISEFVRNQFLLKQYWINHYKSLGLVFPLEPVNGAVWGIWSVLFAVLIFILAQKFSLIQTALISWFAAFVMMWVTIGNLMVLPFGILWYAVPLSLLEAFLASWIIKKIDK
ncbi:MAG: hypothetical protein WCK78_08600 [Paludibacter sp.]